jgi:FKBP-type peptidyl-prolyl cis-trans isomerase FkpA
MNRARAGALTVLALAIVAAGCVDKLSGPACTPMTWSVDTTAGDTIVTTRGLKYIPGVPGTGGAAVWCNNVAVHYTGYYNGNKFDSSRDLDRPLFFTPGVGSLIDGFEQGVIGMSSCETRRLVIPPGLGYGADPVRNDSGVVIIPGNATVVFDVEMLEIQGQPVVVCDSVP